MAAFLGVAALIVAVLAIPLTIWATRQWGTREARVNFGIDSIPLLPEQAGRGLVQVTYRDIPVDAPHLVSVTFRNTGPRDIGTTMFDNGRSISVRFDQTFYGLTHSFGQVSISGARGRRTRRGGHRSAPSRPVEAPRHVVL
jgi:hypothetical protein